MGLAAAAANIFSAPNYFIIPEYMDIDRYMIEATIDNAECARMSNLSSPQAQTWGN